MDGLTPQVVLCPTITESNRAQVDAARNMPLKHPKEKIQIINCSTCEQYQRGSGKPACLKCRNYKEMVDVQAIHKSIQIKPVVSALIEAVPAPAMPENLLQATVQSLHTEDAAIISMHYYGALSVREIAEYLRIPQASARSKLYRAVQHLNNIIPKLYPGVKTKKQAKLQLLMS